MISSSLFAELPESIPEFICDEADMTNYVYLHRSLCFQRSGAPEIGYNTRYWGEV